MIELKTNPSGIDISIQKLNSDLYKRLTKVWPSDIVWNCYGRIYRNRESDIVLNSYNRIERGIVNDGYTAERFMPEAVDGKDYGDVYWNDAVDVVSFFGTDYRANVKTRSMIGVHMVVFCNLKTLKPDLQQTRADEEVRMDFLKVIGKCLYGFHLQSVETTITNVLREYDAGQLKMNTVDYQPVHAFRLNFALAYNPFQTRILTL